MLDINRDRNLPGRQDHATRNFLLALLVLICVGLGAYGLKTAGL